MTDVAALASATTDALISTAALVETRSRHPLARANVAGRTSVVVRRTAGLADVQADAGWHGALGMADAPGPNGHATLERLRGLGVSRIVMLTGDNH